MKTNANIAINFLDRTRERTRSRLLRQPGTGLKTVINLGSKPAATIAFGGAFQTDRGRLS